MKKTQLSFYKTPETEHGGDLSVGKRKERRPFNRKKPLHLTLRSSSAVGEWRLTRHGKFIRALCDKLSRRWDVKVYSLSVNSNHCHLLLRANDRKGFQNFLRVLSGQIAIHITGAVKGSALKKRFFDKLAWTRIIEWGKAFEILKRYIRQNQLETLGAITYVPRKRLTRNRRE